MNDIILKEHIKHYAFIYVFMASIIVLALPLFAIAKHGVSVMSISALIGICVLVILAFILLYNHKSFLSINQHRIAYYKTKGLSKQIKEVWSYDLNDLQKLVFEKTTMALGREVNRVDAIEIILLFHTNKQVNKKFAIWLDSQTESKLKKLGEDHQLNIVIRKG